MARLFILRGIPGSRKSTYARRWLANDRDNRIVLNRDDARQAMFGALHGLTEPQEVFITRTHMDTARMALAKGLDVMIDATNLNNRFLKDWWRVGPCEYIDFPVPIEQAIADDKARIAAGERGVGEAVIRKFAKYVNKDGSLKPPPVPRPEMEYTQYVPDPWLQPAVCVDIDGTLATMTGRSPYDYSLVHTDAIVKHVRDTVRMHEDAGHAVIVLTGRDDDCHAETARWLTENGVNYTQLIMRKTGDKRDDAIVKHEIFHRDIAPTYNVKAVIDDRLRVTRMWHAIGAPLYRVGSPDANF